MIMQVSLHSSDQTLSQVKSLSDDKWSHDNRGCEGSIHHIDYIGLARTRLRTCAAGERFYMEICSKIQKYTNQKIQKYSVMCTCNLYTLKSERFLWFLSRGLLPLCLRLETPVKDNYDWFIPSKSLHMNCSEKLVQKIGLTEGKGCGGVGWPRGRVCLCLWGPSHKSGSPPRMG